MEEAELAVSHKPFVQTLGLAISVESEDDMPMQARARVVPTRSRITCVAVTSLVSA